MRKAPTNRARTFFAPLMATLLLALSLVFVTGSTNTANAAAGNNCQGSSNASEGWIKIDNAAGSASGAFGSLSYNGNGASKTTVFYTLNAGFTLELCIKAGNDDYNSPFITGPVANGQFSATGNNGISHISYRVRVIIPANPTSSDPCGPNNATWNVPADTSAIDWNLSNGVLTATAVNPYFFTDGTKVKNYGTAPDSNASCVTKIDIPAEPGVTDPCGAGNATWNVPADGNGLAWTVNQAGELVVTITAANTEFNNSNNGPTSHNFGTPDETNTAACITKIDIPAEPGVTDPCGAGNATWNVPADGNGLAWTVNQAGELVVTITAANTEFNNSNNGPTSHNFGTQDETNTAACITKINIPAEPGVTDPCGAGNATWNVPADGNGLAWTVNQAGELVVTITAANTEFNNSNNGPTSHNFGTPDETNTAACITKINIPAEPGVTDPCGAGNATWNVPADGNGLAWTVNQAGELVVTITAANTEFNNSNNGPTSHNFGTPDETNTAACITKINIPAEPGVTDPCGAGNATWNVPADGNGLAWTVNQAGELVVTITAANTEFNNSNNGPTSHNFGTPDETNTQACVITVNIPAAPLVNDPCGAGNATWNVPAGGNGLVWTVNQAGELIVTITTQDTQFANSNNGPPATTSESRRRPIPLPARRRRAPTA